MTKNEFQSLFEQNLELAIRNAEHRLQKSLSRNIQIELHGAHHSGDILDVAQSTNLLFLRDDLFYRIVDISVVEVSENFTKVFVRASSHTPVQFDKTWNDPPGNGPFKQLLAEHIRVAKS